LCVKIESEEGQRLGRGRCDDREKLRIEPEIDNEGERGDAE